MFLFYFFHHCTIKVTLICLCVCGWVCSNMICTKSCFSYGRYFDRVQCSWVTIINVCQYTELSGIRWSLYLLCSCELITEGFNTVLNCESLNSELWLGWSACECRESAGENILLYTNSSLIWSLTFAHLKRIGMKMGISMVCFLGEGVCFLCKIHCGFHSL